VDAAASELDEEQHVVAARRDRLDHKVGTDEESLAARELLARRHPPGGRAVAASRAYRVPNRFWLQIGVTSCVGQVLAPYDRAVR
jgi:hypothetical protein